MVPPEHLRLPSGAKPRVMAMDSANKEGSTCVPSTSSHDKSGAVCMGSDRAYVQILDDAGAEVKGIEDGDINFEILRVWDADGNELDPVTLEPIKATPELPQEKADIT